MNILDFLSELRRRDIQLRTVGSNLKVNAPKGAMTSDLLSELQRRKLEVIAFLNELTPADIAAEHGAIKPVSRERNLPLSWTQQRLWFLNQFEPDSPAYNIPSFVLLKGHLEVAAFEGCLREIVRRHEVLRTTFVSVEGEPIQVISPSVNISVPVINLEGLHEKEMEESVRSIVATESRHLFNLQEGPLLRATLLRASATDHYLVSVVHHIAFDGWSAGVFVREMGALYGAFTAGKPSPLPELDIQYADFAYWQRQRLEAETIDNQLAYWKMKLSGQLQKLQLPFDFSQNDAKKYRGEHTSAKLSMNGSERLKSLCHRENATLFMGLLTAFKILLFRYSGMQDIIVGCPIANRNRTEIEGLIGCFLNTLALRTDLSGNPSFRELLARVREVSLGAFANQDVPFEKLLEEIRPDREINRTPVFQVMFVLQNAPMKPGNFPGLTIIPMDTDTGTTKFDLNLHAVETEDGILAVLQYNADFFDSSSMKQLLGTYLTLIENIVADPDQKIANYPLLKDTERKQLRSRHNHIHPVNPFTVFQKEEIEQSIASRFEEIVKKFPGKTAVKTRYREWTYESLNHRANGVANAIIKTCKGEAERIALLFEQDVDMLAGIFGVLKAGKTYVPLDPSYPAERLAYMIKDSQARFLISNDLNIALANELKTDEIHLININETGSISETNRQDISVSPDALAYILYTSGSTGKPKGVVQNNRNVLHFTRVYTNSIHISSEDRLTLVSTYSFDAAVMDIFGALLNGATLYPLHIKEEGVADLSAWLIEQKITIYHSTPTVYRFLVDNLSGNEKFHDLRMIVLGGEAVYKRDIDLYKDHFAPGCLFVNGLGPTESTVSIQYFMNMESDINRHGIPVGYPVEDTELFLINSFGAFDEICGEIGIKSRYLTLGYWNKPEITKEAFLPDPSVGNERIYRTGDMGRFLPDGSIEFLGRRDFQVKIRGYRIEVGEIETALIEHPAVGNAAVFTKTNNGKEHLIACVVLNDSGMLDRNDMRRFLQKKLPDYMIPSTFVVGDALPLTPTNKVDRLALAQLEVRFEGIVAEEPLTEMEKAIADIWKKSLELDQISVHDNFFEIGGHSLLSIQVISQIENKTGLRLNPREFIYQTLGQLAASLEQQTPVHTQAEGMVKKNGIWQTIKRKISSLAHR